MCHQYMICIKNERLFERGLTFIFKRMHEIFLTSYLTVFNCSEDTKPFPKHYREHQDEFNGHFHQRPPP